MAPCSPFLMMTNFGPIASTFSPARTRLTSSVSIRASPSLSTSPSISFRRACRSSRWVSIQKFIVSATASFRPFDCARTLRCIEGLPLARKTNGVSRKLGGRSGLKVPRTLRWTSSVSARVHVALVLASPAERLAALLDDQARGVDLSTFEELAVLGREVLADDADEPDGREVARRVGKIGGRPAQGVVGDAVRGLDRVESDRADDEQGHPAGSHSSGESGQPRPGHPFLATEG